MAASATINDAVERLAELIEAGRADLAVDEAAALRGRFPAAVEVIRLQAIALFQLGRNEEARAALGEAHALAPSSIEVLCNLASVLLACADAPAAIAMLNRAMLLEPTHPAVLNGMGNARRAAGDPEGAREAYARATQAMPDHVGAWFNLAAADLALGDAAAAERTARHALNLAPGHPEGLLVLGHSLAAEHRYAAAEEAYSLGATAAPADPRFPYHIGLMAEEQHHVAQACAAHAQALALDPDFAQALGQLVFLRRQLCDWRDLGRLSKRLRDCVAAQVPHIAPFAFLAEPDADAAEQLRCARTFAVGVQSRVAALRARTNFKHRLQGADARLRLGFLANGFGNHPTNLLVVAFFEALRDENVEAHLFSTAPDDDSPALHRLRAAAHTWHDVSQTSAPMLAQSIHRAAIDVLIDLDGYCAGSLPSALALRPAALQVNWLAYPGTLGADWIDYVIADRSVLPESLHAAFSEAVAWMPRCFQPSDPTRLIVAPPSRAASGLPDAGVVYACFNNRFKINPSAFTQMLAILQEVPASVLWLLSGPDAADQRLRDYARERGIDASRLVFAPKIAHAEYLARYAHVDLFLDTAPYGAHTTASDAIWAGCPVLTVAGEVFAARVATSLNEHLGMPQLVRRNSIEFVREAVRLGLDIDARTALRSELADRRASSGLFDMHDYARDFVTLVRRMVERQHRGQPPALLE